MHASRYWVGVDYGQTRSNVCILDDAGATVQQCECKSDATSLKSALSVVPAREIARIGWEAACGVHIVRKLRCDGYNVVLFETRKLKRLLEIRRNKNDKNDARGIADAARLARELPTQVHLKSVDCQHLRTRLQLRQQLIQQRLAAEGFVRSLLHLHGCGLPRTGRGTSFQDKVREELERLWLSEGIALFDEIEPLADLACNLRSHIKRMDAWLDAVVKENPVCRRFLDIPGVGPVCALSFFSAVGEPTRFRQTSDIAAYFGLAPRLHESGEVRRMFGITRMGNKLTRGHLYIAARHLLRVRSQTSNLQEWALALQKRVGPGRARIAVARKLAIVMLSMWKHETRFESDHQPT